MKVIDHSVRGSHMIEIASVEEVEAAYVKFYKERGYRIYGNKPILSKDDPTLLLVNSTIALFKDAINNREFIPDTAQVQDCFRANGDLDNPAMMLYFKMVGNVAMIDSIDKVLNDFISFLTDICKIPSERIYGVIREDDTDLQRAWKTSPLRENLEKVSVGEALQYSTRWTYGEGYNFTGRGLTIVCDNPSIPSCGSHCDIKCPCDKYLQLGNLIIVESEEHENKYLDLGFGLERIAAYQSNNETYQLPEFQVLINELIGIGLGEAESKKIINLVRGAFKLIDVGVVPANKKEGYILKSIIRHLANELICHGGKEFKKVNDTYHSVYKVLEGFDNEINSNNNEWIVNEINKYINSIGKGINQAKKYIKKNKNQDKRLMKKELTSTYGIPLFLIEDLIKEIEELTLA
jgi:alanyl-tRNA synthetase